MKKIILFFSSFLVICSANCQKRADIGVFGGTNFYLGDINPLIPFNTPSYFFGGIYRYNITERYAVRLNGVYANLKDSDPNNYYPQFSNASFSTNIFDFAGQFEFNYSPYIPKIEQGDFSTYLCLGIGGNFQLGEANVVNLTIPFGTGFKYNLTTRISTGIEWSFRKTFNDRLDGYETFSQGGSNSFLFNNDWYSFLGLFITYKFFNFAENCPAYYN